MKNCATCRVPRNKCPTPRAEFDMEAIRNLKKRPTNTGDQANWLKDPDGITQGPAIPVVSGGLECGGRPGCDLCFSTLELLWAELHGIPMPHIAPIPENLVKPYRFKKPRNIFLTPRGDLFHDRIIEKYPGYVGDVMRMVRDNDIHNLVLSTKRPHNLHVLNKLVAGVDNLYVGVSVESQEFMDHANSLLLLPHNIHRVLFLAPLITEVKIKESVLDEVCLVVVSPERGGVGRPARPCKDEWILSVIDQVKGYRRDIALYIDFKRCDNKVLKYGDSFDELPASMLTEMAA